MPPEDQAEQQGNDPGYDPVYAAPNGSESGDGTLQNPYDIDTALASVLPGGSVVFRGGVYRQLLGGLWNFWPTGYQSGLDNMITTYKAYPRERPVFSKDGDIAPRVSLGDWVTLDGLWMGGDPDALSDDGLTVETGKHAISMGGYDNIRNCTFFGYWQGVIEGSGRWNTYSNNRFVRCGQGRDTTYPGHPIYLARVLSGVVEHYSRVMDSILVNCETDALQMWHGTSRNTVAGNFIGRSDACFAMNGYGHIVKDNIFWKPNGGMWQGPTPYAAAWDKASYVDIRRIFFANNEFFSALDLSNSIMDDCHMYKCLRNTGGQWGTNYKIVQQSDIPGLLGYSEDAIDAAIDALNISFRQTIQQIHDDATIETHFATLKAVIDTWKSVA